MALQSYLAISSPEGPRCAQLAQHLWRQVLLHAGAAPGAEALGICAADICRGWQVLVQIPAVLLEALTLQGSAALAGSCFLSFIDVLTTVLLAKSALHDALHIVTV